LCVCYSCGGSQKRRNIEGKSKRQQNLSQRKEKKNRLPIKAMATKKKKEKKKKEKKINQKKEKKK